MTNTNDTQESTPHTQSTGDIVAVADTWYRGKMTLMSLAIILYCGVYFLYDGFIGYPKLNRQLDDLSKQIDAAPDKAQKDKLTSDMFALGNHHDDMGILLQKIIGFVSLPLGCLLFYSAMRKSRGEIRLSGQTLQVPGHPPVAFDAITSMDQRLWDKKGIAYVNYSLPEGQNGVIKLDDFVYKRQPIDEIHKRITQYLAPPEESETSPQTKSPGT